MDKNKSIAPIATRDEGLNRLRAFLPNAGAHYTKKRNFDFGAGSHEHVSCLSPYMRTRLICEEEVCAAVLAHYTYATCEKFIQEVLWRSYFKGWLELRPSIWDNYISKRNFALSSLNTDETLAVSYNKACRGETGIDAFDFWAKELVDTGYLHNHARMWFASIWIFTLKLPWVLGADYFLQHLIDGDAASNTLSWRWVAGLHTQGKHYVARAENITKFTNGRFNPQGLALNPSPLEDVPHPVPIRLPEIKPFDSREKVFLLMTDDDCSFSTQGLTIGAGAAWNTTDARSAHPIGVHAQPFAINALKDATRRLKTECTIPVTSDIHELVDMIRSSGLSTVYTPWVPAGYNRDCLKQLIKQLPDVVFYQKRHPWDEMTWPHATGGYFKLKKKIPSILKHIGAFKT